MLRGAWAQVADEAQPASASSTRQPMNHPLASTRGAAGGDRARRLLARHPTRSRPRDGASVKASSPSSTSADTTTLRPRAARRAQGAAGSGARAHKARAAAAASPATRRNRESYRGRHLAARDARLQVDGQLGASAPSDASADLPAQASLAGHLRHGRCIDSGLVHRIVDSLSRVEG